MATTTNGIATEGEAKTKIGSSAVVTTDLLITKARVYEIGGNVDNANSYGSNQCVKYSDILAGVLYNWYLASDLAQPYTILSATEPDTNDRLDAIPLGFSSYTMEYSCIEENLIRKYYPWSLVGDYSHSMEPTRDSIYTGYGIYLNAVTNCYFEGEGDGSQGSILTTVADLGMLQGLNNTDNDLQNEFPDIAGNLTSPPYTYRHESGEPGAYVVPIYDDSGISYVHYFHLNSSLCFSIIYDVAYFNGNYPSVISYLPATYSILFYDDNSTPVFKDLYVSNMSFNIGYITYENDNLHFYDSTNQPSNAIFRIDRTINNAGKLIITFTKCAETTSEYIYLPSCEYFLTAFRPNFGIMNKSYTSAQTILVFQYRNLDDIYDLGDMSYSGIDFWSMYDIKFSTLYDFDTHISSDSIPVYETTIGEGIPATILINLPYNIYLSSADGMWLIYNRGILDLTTFETNSGSSRLQTSFTSDTSLKNNTLLGSGNTDVAYVVVPKSYLEDYSLDPGDGDCIDFSSTYIGISESSYSLYITDLSVDVSVVEYPRSIQVAVHLSSDFINYLVATSLPFYLYYRNYYYKFTLS